jgi:branched-chain amino acid transport system permease protein
LNMIPFDVLMTGIVLGALYSLMALGLTLIWGTVNVLNFGHGALIMLGGYVTYLLMTGETRLFELGLSLNVTEAMILALPVFAVIGIILSKTTIHPILKHPTWDRDAIFTTVGFNIAAIEIVRLTFGPRIKLLPPIIEGSLGTSGVSVRLNDILIIVLSISILGLMTVLLRKTRQGMAVRAVPLDTEGANLVGINISRIYLYVVIASAVLAGLSGVFLAGIYFLSPSVGEDMMFLSFIIVGLGGVRSVKGTITAAYVAGMMEALVGYYIGVLFVLPVLFCMLIVMLIVRPQGLFKT